MVINSKIKKIFLVILLVVVSTVLSAVRLFSGHGASKTSLVERTSLINSASADVPSGGGCSGGGGGGGTASSCGCGPSSCGGGGTASSCGCSSGSCGCGCGCGCD